MNKEKLFQRLCSLQKRRGDLEAFSSHDEFLQWADQVLPLLGFNPKLQTLFQWYVTRANAAYLKRGEHHEDLQNAIGVVTQAVAAAEILVDAAASSPVNDTTQSIESASEADISAASSAALHPPEKVTLRWVFDHMSLGGWAKLAGAFVFVFTVGIGFANIPFLSKSDNDCLSGSTNTLHGGRPVGGGMPEGNEGFNGGSGFGGLMPHVGGEGSLIRKAPADQVIEQESARSFQIGSKADDSSGQASAHYLVEGASEDPASD